MKTLPTWPEPPAPVPQSSRCLRLLFPHQPAKLQQPRGTGTLVIPLAMASERRLARESKRRRTPAAFFIILAATTATVTANPPEQPQIDFTQSVQGTFNADWEGIAARTYFMQFSMNLIDWHYAPFIDFGDGTHHRGIESDADKMFLRLAFGDFPGINSLDDAMNADFSGDGLSNIFKVTHGYDPFDNESTEDGPDAGLDPDGDGLSNASEQALGRDPMRKDHPALELEVIVD